MNFKRMITILIILSAICPRILAFDLTGILDQLQETYETASDWQADFIQSTYVELLQKTIDKKGMIFIKKGGRLRIGYEEGKIYVSDGKRLWIYSPEDHQVEIFQKLSPVLSREALSLLEGLGNLRSEFGVGTPSSSELSQSDFIDRSLAAVKLIPRRGASSIQKVVIGVDEKKFLVREMTIFNTSGNRTHYLFSHIRLNSGLSDDLFRFEAPEGVREIRGHL